MASSSNTALDDSFNAGTIDDVLSCPVCLELFDSPRILPSCGHSFCFNCVSKILQLSNDSTRISCPECRLVSVLGPNGVYGLRTNIQLQRTIALYEISTTGQSSPSEAAGSRSSDSFHDTCPHVFLTKHPLACDHCGMKFCNGCGIAHMEKMKVEMITLASGFLQRTDAAKEGIDEMQQAFKVRLNEQFEQTKEEITLMFESLSSKFLAAIAKAQTVLMTKAEIARDVKMNEALTVWESGLASDIDLNDRITTLQTKSVLNCGLEEISQLYQRVAEKDLQIVALEKLRSEPLNGKIAFTIQQASLEKEILGSVSNLQEVDLAWKSTVDIENEHLRLATSKVHAAAKSGNLAALQEILEDEKLPDATRRLLTERTEDTEPSNSITPLMQACKCGQVEIVRYLLEKQVANVRAALIRRNVSSIHLACQSGHLNVVKYLLDFDPDLLRLRNASGATPLAYAVHHGQLNVTKFLIEEKNVDLEEIGAQKTPLMEAATRGHLSIVEYLISRGAEMYARQPKSGNIAAHFAAIAGCVDVMRYFLDRRPDLLIVKNYKGLTMIDMASDQQAIRILESLGARRRSIPDF